MGPIGVIRECLDEDVRTGSPGWRWRWWMTGDWTEIQTVDEVIELTARVWGDNLLTAVAGAEVRALHGHEAEVARVRRPPRQGPRRQRFLRWCAATPSAPDPAREGPATSHSAALSAPVIEPPVSTVSVLRAVGLNPAVLAETPETSGLACVACRHAQKKQENDLLECRCSRQRMVQESSFDRPERFFVADVIRFRECFGAWWEAK